ncbi:hypothetical protein D3C80_1424390 [compost metagenome]
MQSQTTAAGLRHGHGRLDLGLDALARQGLDHHLALPRQIGLVRPVLQGGDAAFGIGLGMDRAAVGTGFDQVERLDPSVLHLGRDHFARQGARHKDKALGRFGDPVALVAHAGDGQRLRHGAASTRSRAESET